MFPVHKDTQLNVADDAHPGINKLDRQPQLTVVTCCHGDSSRRAEIRFEGRVKSSGEPMSTSMRDHTTKSDLMGGINPLPQLPQLPERAWKFPLLFRVVMAAVEESLPPL